MQTDWDQSCTEATKKYNLVLKEEGQSGKTLNVYDYLTWLNESDETVLGYLPKRTN